jgi:hypothetical protein
VSSFNRWRHRKQELNKLNLSIWVYAVLLNAPQTWRVNTFLKYSIHDLRYVTPRHKGAGLENIKFKGKLEC